MNLPIQKNVPLAPLTTFAIGGAARFFVVVRSVEELTEALSFAKDKKVQYFILAGGSNVLFSDEGFDGLVIKIDFDTVDFNGDVVTCGAGIVLFDFIKMCIEKGFAGYENLSGVPGSVGGAVRGNAGAFGTEIKDHLTSVRIFDTQTRAQKDILLEECHFSYRQSVFKNTPSWIITSATFALKKTEKEDLQKHSKQIVAEREAKHIQNIQSAGSFFMNPISPQNVQEAFEKDKKTKSKQGRVPAGWLLEEVGLSQKRIGDIQAGQMHANYFVNHGKGTADEVLQLASLAKARVRDTFGVQLKEEVTIVPFEQS